MSYQRQANATQAAPATSGTSQTPRFNSAARGSTSSMSMNPNTNTNSSQPTTRTSTPNNRLLDELLALGGRIEHYQPQQHQPLNLSSAENQSNITIIDYRQQQPPGPSSAASSSLLFGGANGSKLERKSTFDQFASQFKSSLGLGDKTSRGRGRPTAELAPSSRAQAPLPPPLLTGNVKILDIRRTKTNRKRPKTDDGESAAPIQLAHGDEYDDDEDDYAGDYEDSGNGGQRERPAGNHQQEHLSATNRNRSQTLSSRQQQQQNQQQPQQRQQSGETLSSFESDYDLLVYLGETETEDLVETERSLDYLDQTWRQSICGGASLAPTIDESLSELLSPNASQQHNSRIAQLSTPTRATPIDYNDDFDLLWTTGGGAGGGAASPSFETNTLSSLQRQQQQQQRAPHLGRPLANHPNSNQSNLLPDLSYGGQLSGGWSASLPRQPNYRPPSQPSQSPSQSSQQQRTGGPQVAASLSSAAATATGVALKNQQQQPKQPQSTQRALAARERELELLSKQLEEASADQATHQAHAGGHSLAGNIGNKLVSLFGRNTKQPQSITPPRTDRQGHNSATSGSPRQEIDTVQQQLNELLNQPKDGPQMAPQKPRRQQYAIADTRGPYGHQAREGNADELDRLLAEMSQSLDLDSLARYDPFAGSSNQRQQQQPNATNHQARSYAVNKPQVSQTTAIEPVRQRHEPATLPTTNRNESILNEYDGASRMLEQMISDQLEEALGGDSRLQQQQQTAQPVASASNRASASPTTTTHSSSPPKQVARVGGRQVEAPSSAATSSSARAKRFALANKRGSSSRQTTNHSSQATSDEERASASSSSQVRKISSTCSSVTTEASVVPATTRLHQQQTNRPLEAQVPPALSRQALWRSQSKTLEAETRQQADPNLARHHRHQSSFDEPSSPGRPRQRNMLNYSRSLDVDANENAPTLQATTKTTPEQLNRKLEAEVRLKEAPIDLPDKPPRPASIKSSSSTTSLSSAEAEQVPPVPPAVDYSDYPEEEEAIAKQTGAQFGTKEGLSKHSEQAQEEVQPQKPGERVIQVEANDVPSPTSSEDDEPNPSGSGHKRVMNRMKRRTMSGVRSMRQRLNRHFSGPSGGTGSGENEATKQQQASKTTQPSQAQPEPPARSSSIGSAKSGSRVDQPKTPVDSESPRQSRQRERRSNKQAHPNEPAENKSPEHEQGAEDRKSFGQQLRERLSRSKSRFSRFLRPLSTHRQQDDTAEDEAVAKRKRAKSTTPLNSGGDRQLNTLFQPGDIARNEPQVGLATSGARPATNESSLERQLRADLERIRPPPTTTVEEERLKRQAPGTGTGTEQARVSLARRRSQDSDRSLASGDLSGLETTDTHQQRLFGRRPARSSKRKSKTMQQQQQPPSNTNQAPKRPTSLMSLKKFSESFGNRSSKLNTSDADDLDSILKVKASEGQQQQKSSGSVGSGGRGSSRRSSRNKRLRNRSAGDQRPTEESHSSSPSRLETVTPQRATTDDYFGLRSPIKTSGDSANVSASASKSRSPDVHQRIEMGPRVRPASAMLQTRDQEDVPPQSESSGNKLFGRRRQRVAPNRSQSLKSVDRPTIKIAANSSEQPASLEGALEKGLTTTTPPEGTQEGARQKSVSFQNLSPAANQRRQLSPVSPNTFRPVSASGETGLTTTTTHPLEGPLMTTHRGEPGSITPIQLSTPVLANSLPTAAPNATEATSAPESSQADSSPRRGPPAKSPIRERGAALLGDLRTKYTDFFRPASRGEQQTTKAAVTGPETSTAELPPSRPPRHRKRRQPDEDHARRARSLAAPSVTVIEVEPSSPPASLLLSESPDLQQQQQVGGPKRGVKRLTSFAQQLKTSAVDFFGAQQASAQPVHGPNHQARLGAQQQQQKQHAAGSTVDRRPHFRNLDEPLVQRDLAEWRPIIPIGPKAQAGSRRRIHRSSSFKLPKDQDHSGQERSRTLGLDQMGLSGAKKSRLEADSDSTWDSSSSSSDDDDDHQDQGRGVSSSNRSVPKVNEQRQQQAVVAKRDQTTRLDESSAATTRESAAATSNATDERQQVYAAVADARSARGRAEQARAGCLPSGSALTPAKGGSSTTTTKSSSNRLDHAAPSSFSEADKNNNEARELASTNKRTKPGDNLQTTTTTTATQSKRRPNQFGEDQTLGKTETSTADLQPATSRGVVGKLISNYSSKQQQLQQQQQDNETEPAAASRPIDDGSSCTAPTRKQTESQQNLFAKRTPPTQSVNERAFKFNQNLPSPDELLNETRLKRQRDSNNNNNNNNNLYPEQAQSGAAMTATRSIAGVRGPRGARGGDAAVASAVSSINDKAQPPDSLQEDRDLESNNNRLSIYENVGLQDATDCGLLEIAHDGSESRTTDGPRQADHQGTVSTSSQQRENNNRENKPPSPKKPELPSRPQNVQQKVHKMEASSTRKQTDDSREDDWSVEPDDQLVERVLSKIPAKANEQLQQQQQEDSARSIPQNVVGVQSRRAERKLVPMTSIIHEPEDDLMNLHASSQEAFKPLSAKEQQQQQQKQQQPGVWASEGRRYSNMSSFSIQNDSDQESDSSMAGCGRRRLEHKLNKQANRLKKPPVPGRPPNLPRASGPAGSGGGGSLVKRLARNFDQTVQEQPAAAPVLPRGTGSNSGRASGPSNQQVGSSSKLAQAVSTTKQLPQELVDEPKSDSTWYDAKSVELLDEAEVAELLREFESDGQLSSSEQYLTMSHDQPGRRDRRRKERAAGEGDDDEEEDDDDEDPTLNDDETLNDANDDDDQDDDLLEESESVYASAATNQNMSTAGRVDLAAAGQQQQQNETEVGSGGGGAGETPPKVALEWRALTASHAGGRQQVACSNGELVVRNDDDDVDSIDDLKLAPNSNENSLRTIHELEQSQLTEQTQQVNKDKDGNETDNKKEKEPLVRRRQQRQQQAQQMMGPQLVGNNNKLASEDTQNDIEGTRTDSCPDQTTSDKQIFTHQLKAAFQSDRGASETKAPVEATTATQTNDNDTGEQSDHEDDAASMVGELGNSERSSSYREDLVSLSSSSLSSESMPELRQRKNLQRLYNIVNEICTSEEKFVATLRLLNEDFRRHILASLQPDSNTSSSTGNSYNNNNSNTSVQLQPPFDCIGLVLKHLPQLQMLNENLLDELRQARNQWPSTQKISHVLVKIGPFLKHYSSYIRDFECIQQQFQENVRKSSQFRDIIKRFEVEQADKCSHLSIQHHLLKPIQRIPQYRLLLQQYLHHLKPDDADYEDTVSALEVVSRVAEHANHSLSEGANFAKLLALQAKIVGGKHRRDLIQPGRLLIREGELLKVCRKQIQPRWFVLLSDSLLYLKQIQSNDILYLKYELPLDDCQLELPGGKPAGNLHRKRTATTGSVVDDGDDRHLLEAAQENEDESKLSGFERLEREEAEAEHECEFNVCTTVRSMTLIAKSRQERDDWFEALQSAIENHVAKRRSFRPAGGSSGNGSGADNNNPTTANGQDNNGQLGTGEEALSELIGRKAPIWTPDSRVNTCQLCTSNFSALFRRHHCRACGRVVCSACSSNKAPLIYLKCKAARVCDQCFESLRANMHLYYLPSCQIDERELRRLDEHFKTLLKSQFVKRRMFVSHDGTTKQLSKSKSKAILARGPQTGAAAAGPAAKD